MSRREANGRRGVRPRLGLFALCAAGAVVRVARVLHFATPRPVAGVICQLIDLQPGMEVYDPSCGDGRLLFAAHRLVATRSAYDGDGHHDRLSLWGQERDVVAYLLLRLHALRLGLNVNAARGDTLRRPAFVEGSERSVRRFDRIVANPFWSQPLPDAVYRSDPYGRFSFGVPPESNADWGWIQHMHASLKDDGQLVVILDSEVTSRGEVGSPEGAIRQAFVEQGLVQTVVTCGGPFEVKRRLRGALARAVLPEAAMLVMGRQPRSADRVLFIDISSLIDSYARGEASRQASIQRLLDIYRQRAAIPSLSTTATSGDIAARGYDLAPRHWITPGAA